VNLLNELQLTVSRM